MKVFLVAGARPNFMKIAPIYRASRKVAGVNCQIVHTGQHYDYEMSQAFFEDLEIPQSVVEIYSKRVSFFGGGYLRLAPIPLIKWGIGKLQESSLPLVVYVHPREVDPEHPRLPLKLHRRFKSYVNLRSTIPKLHWLCENYRFQLMKDYVKDSFTF